MIRNLRHLWLAKEIAVRLSLERKENPIKRLETIINFIICVCRSMQLVLLNCTFPR